MTRAFTPRYRIQIAVPCTDIRRTVTIEGNEDAHAGGGRVRVQVGMAIQEAQSMFETYDRTEIVKVERETAGGTWEELITARSAVPGTQIKLIRMHRDLHRAHSPYYVGEEWATVARWHGNGDGTARLILSDSDSPVRGDYGPDDIFVKR